MIQKHKNIAHKTPYENKKWNYRATHQQAQSMLNQKALGPISTSHF